MWNSQCVFRNSVLHPSFNCDLPTLGVLTASAIVHCERRVHSCPRRSCCSAHADKPAGTWRNILRQLHSTKRHLTECRKSCFRGTACHLELCQALLSISPPTPQAHSSVDAWPRLSPTHCTPAKGTLLKLKCVVKANLKGTQTMITDCLNKYNSNLLCLFSATFPIKSCVQSSWQRCAELQTSFWTRTNTLRSHVLPISHFGIHCTRSKPF